MNSSAPSKLRLNRRHKVTLFLTLVLAGIGLVSGDTIRTALGVVLLGIGFAWATGSDNRVVHWLFVGSGTLLVMATLVYDSHVYLERTGSYNARVTEFERKIPVLATKYSFRSCPHQDDALTKAFGGRPVADKENGCVYYPHSMTEADLRSEAAEAAKKSQAKWYADAVAAGVDMVFVPDEEKPGEAPESFQRILWNARAPEILGVLLSFIGIGLLVGVKATPN